MVLDRGRVTNSYQQHTGPVLQQEELHVVVVGEIEKEGGSDK